jgi:hypothetical protein
MLPPATSKPSRAETAISRERYIEPTKNAYRIRMLAKHYGYANRAEAGFHIGMDRNFVCLWRRHNCGIKVIDLSLSALIY